MISSFIFCCAVAFAFPARASELWDYVTSYQPGIEYLASANSSTLDYSTPLTAQVPDGCQNQNSTSMRCSIELNEEAVTGFGFFLTHPFQSQGLFFYDWGMDFHTAQVDSRYEGSHLNQYVKNARVKFLGLTAREYLRVGVTPESLPDVLFTAGLGAQASRGKISINDISYDVMNVDPEVSLELAAVWYRFGDGYLSSYISVFAPLGITSYKLADPNLSNVQLYPAHASIALVSILLPLF